MSDYLKGARPRRSTLNLTNQPSTRSTSNAERGQRMYGNKSALTIGDAAAQMSALAHGEPPAPTIGDAAGQLSALAHRTNPQEQRSALEAVSHQPSALSDFGDLDTEFEASPTDSLVSAASDALTKLAYNLGGNQRFKLCRDRDRPLEFDGRVAAQVEERSHGGQVLLRAAIYETRGGKFVTEMTRREVVPVVDYGAGKRPFLFAKVAVFENRDLAAMSFRTNGGRLTERLLAQIADLNSEFIE